MSSGPENRIALGQQPHGFDVIPAGTTIATLTSVLGSSDLHTVHHECRCPGMGEFRAGGVGGSCAVDTPENVTPSMA